MIAELKRVFDSDVGKKLISLEIGNMTKDLQELIKAGAILDNTKITGMVGFVKDVIDQCGMGLGAVARMDVSPGLVIVRKGVA